MLIASSFVHAKSYDCKYENDNERKKIDITIKDGNGSIVLDGKKYNNCKLDKDEFGQLLDCGDLELDLMVLVNQTEENITGGIMSSTYDLFVDLECE